MKIYASNGVYLGVIENNKGIISLVPERIMTLYMLEEAVKQMKKVV